MAYAYQATVVIPAASGSTQTNISLVITGTAARLRSAANGGAIQNTVTRVGQTVPADLILSSDAAGTLLYNWGWDFWDPVNGIATIWLLMPSHSSSSSTTVYISVGNIAISAYQGGAQGAEFDSSTRAVYHFPDGTTLSAKDFSSNSNDGTPTTVAVSAGQIDGAASFNGTSSNVNIPSVTSVDINTTPYTLQGWIKPSATATFGPIISKEHLAGNGYYLDYGRGGNGIISFGVNAGANEIVSSISPTLNVWTHIAGVSNGTSLIIYINGAANSTGGTSLAPTSVTDNLFVGGSTSLILWFPGLLDEVKISKANRSADWIATEYGNQNSIPTMGAFSAFGTAYTKAVSEVFTLSETFLRSITRSLADPFTLAETLAKRTARVLTDTITLVETYSRLFTVKRAFIEVYSLLDSISLITPSRFVYNEVYTLVETFIAKLLRDPSIAYYRQYMLDLTGIAAPSISPSFTFIGPADQSNEYYRKYLGKV